MLSNPKTTIAGYLLLVGSAATLVAHLLGGGVTSADWTAVMSGLAGIGLIASADGGH